MVVEQPSPVIGHRRMHVARAPEPQLWYFMTDMSNADQKETPVIALPHTRWIGHARRSHS